MRRRYESITRTKEMEQIVQTLHEPSACAPPLPHGNKQSGMDMATTLNELSAQDCARLPAGWPATLRRAAEMLRAEQWNSASKAPELPARVLLCQYRVSRNSKPVVGPLWFDGIKIVFPFQALTVPIVLAWKEMNAPTPETMASEAA